jgi:hypothetical protein
MSGGIFILHRPSGLLAGQGLADYFSPHKGKKNSDVFG